MAKLNYTTQVAGPCRRLGGEKIAMTVGGRHGVQQRECQTNPFCVECSLFAVRYGETANPTKANPEANAVAGEGCVPARWHGGRRRLEMWFCERHTYLGSVYPGWQGLSQLSHLVSVKHVVKWIFATGLQTPGARRLKGGRGQDCPPHVASRPVRRSASRGGRWSDFVRDQWRCSPLRRPYGLPGTQCIP